jgi:hypothetical protein
MLVMIIHEGNETTKGVWSFNFFFFFYLGLQQQFVEGLSGSFVHIIFVSLYFIHVHMIY